MGLTISTRISTFASRLALVGALIILSACSSDSDGTSDSTDTPHATTDQTAGSGNSSDADGELESKTFVASQIDGERQIVEGTQIEVTFLDGQITVVAGCNTMVGEVSTEDGILTVGQMASTLMACEQPMMDQDAWLGELFESAPTWSLDGDTLTIQGADSTLHLQQS